MNSYLIEQLQIHKSIQPVDVIKMTYQSVFGADHLLKDIDRAYQYFLQEYDSTMAADIILIEDISELYGRANIASWKYNLCDRDELFDRFVHAAGRNSGSNEKFLSQLSENDQTLQKMFDSQKYEQFHIYFQNYLAEGIRPVSHSAIYHQKENPAYRIVIKK